MTPIHPVPSTRVWTPTRRSAPTGLARGDWLVNQLPLGMLQDVFLVRFVRIFQDMATVYLDHVDSLAHQLDPAVAPPSMVRYLGRWLGVRSIDPTLPARAPARHRPGVVDDPGVAGNAARSRDSCSSSISGAPADVTDTAGVFHEGETPANAGFVVARVESVGWATEPALVELVRSEIPAGARLEFWIGDRRVVDDQTTPDDDDRRGAVAHAPALARRRRDATERQGGPSDA